MTEPTVASGIPRSASATAGPPAHNDPSGAARAASDDHRDAKVLIVDDTPANLDLLRDMLKPLGSQIFFATSGAMALDIAGSARPDLILLDIMMPRMDGLETCRRLKATKGLTSIPVIFVTARTDMEGLVQGFEAGGVDYITKPVKQPEVHARVNAHLKIQGLIRQQSETLSELEAAKKELQELNATKDKFLSSIGRALRDSLTEISAASQAIKVRALGDQPAQTGVDGWFEDVNRTAETVRRLLESILEWPRIQAGQKLDLLDTEVTDRDLGYLVEPLENLRFLSLAGTKITDAGLEHIAALRDLKELHLDGTAISSRGLELLSGLGRLEVLDLKDTAVTDDGLAHLKPLGDLKALYLSRTPVSDAGLTHVGALTGLRTLVLWETSVTDAGLRSLQSLRHLRELVLWKTRVTEQGAAELKRALPDCEISTGMFM